MVIHLFIYLLKSSKHLQKCHTPIWVLGKNTDLLKSVYIQKVKREKYIHRMVKTLYS